MIEDNKMQESAFLKEIQSTSSDVDVVVFANFWDASDVDVVVFANFWDATWRIYHLMNQLYPCLTLWEISKWNVFEFYSDKHLLWEGHMVIPGSSALK